MDTGALAVGGDSAGGNLTAAVTLMARDERNAKRSDSAPDIAHQVLVYPAVASPTLHDFASYEENAEGYFLEWESTVWFYDHYLQRPTDRRNEYAAPLLARDLSDLPPATVVTAGFDPLRDEGMVYADRLENAGVAVSRHHYEGMIHGFVNLIDMMDDADDALDAIAADLDGAF